MFKHTLSEWHKQLWVLCAAISIIILCKLVFDIGWVLFLISLLWLLAGSAAGALAYAKATTRSSSDRAPYDFSTAILVRKLLLGVTAAFLLSVIATLVLIVVFSLSIRNLTFNARSFIPYDYDFKLLPVGLLPAFASAVLLSTISRRVFLAAVSSLATASVLFFSMFFLWHKLDFNSFNKLGWMIGSLSITALILIGASFRISIRYSRNEKPICSIMSGVIFISLVTILISGCLVFAYLRTNSYELLSSLEVSPTGRHVLAVYMTADGLSEYGSAKQVRVLLLPVNPKSGKRMVRRNAYEADFSPDGNWIIYFSQQSRLGLVSDLVSLRACRIDGSDDRVLVRDFAQGFPGNGLDCGLRIAVSPDGTQVAMRCGDYLYIAGFDGHSIRKVRLSFESGDHLMIGFHPNGAEVLFLSSGKGLIACNPTGGNCRFLLKSEYWLNQYDYSTRRNKIPIRQIRQILLGFQLFDIESSTTRLLPDSGNGSGHYLIGADLSRDQRTLVYAVDPRIAKEIVTDLLEWEVVTIEGPMILDAMELNQKHSFSFWDSLIIAAAEKAGCTLLLSEDLSSGRSIGKIKIKNPFETADIV
jgi:hypothetical protein